MVVTSVTICIVVCSGLGIFYLCWHLGGLEMKRVENLERCRTMFMYPHVHQRIDCPCGYSDSRKDRDVYDLGSTPDAVHRRRDADRDSAGETLDEPSPESGILSGGAGP